MMKFLKTLLPILCFAAATTLCAQSKMDPPQDIQMLLMKNSCSGCHAVETKLVGPSYMELSKKKYSNEKIVELVHKPNAKDWPGYPAMAALPQAPKAEILKIAAWINTLRTKK